ncbi:MAG: exodeoxyribonuclease V subunit alpha [Desulfopila sp.]|jgi:exodeoxyribonuclease V alpha subunit|nr:exodeoxyribonuclease V subunit alpha [Desulfopila sp.]
MTELQENLLGIHLSAMLVQKSGLSGHDRERFSLLIQSLVAALDEGNSCLPVDRGDEVILRRTSLVSNGEKTPLVLYGACLYLHRYYHYEQQLAYAIRQLADREVEQLECGQVLDTAFGVADKSGNLQRKSAQLAAGSALTLISGGPGTGKTTTVVRILGILLSLLGTQIRIALAAPTGKAAMRLRQSVVGAVDGLVFAEEIRRSIPADATTLHRLLGFRRNSVQFRHNRSNPLPYDVVVVDEASMVDLALMSKLVDALAPTCRLILIGDKDQLTSVESGAVLSDLIQCFPDKTVVLKKSYRFDTAIKSLAEAVNSNDSALAWSLLEGDSHEKLQLLGEKQRDALYKGYGKYLEYAASCSPERYTTIFTEFSRFRILCALRVGRYGVDTMNRQIEEYVMRRYGYEEEWYPGRPVMIGRNDYSLQLFNGDIGICLLDPRDGLLKIWFEDGEGGLKSFLPFRLPQYQLAYAMTIHKSQGSEFDTVVIVLPDQDNPVLSRELLYTAITRGIEGVGISADKEVFVKALSRKTLRSSGLAAMLREK